MTRILPSLLCLVLLVSVACGAGDTDTSAPAAPAATASESSQPTPESARQSAAAPAALPADDACGLLPAAAVTRHVAAAAGASIEVADDLEASRFNDDSRSCTWRWDGHRVQLQVTAEPSGNRFDTWASRMVAERVENRGFETVDGFGDGAAFLADGSELFWRQGEERIYSLSYGGPTPQARLDRDTLLALAAEVRD